MQTWKHLWRDLIAACMEGLKEIRIVITSSFRPNVEDSLVTLLEPVKAAISAGKTLTVRVDIRCEVNTNDDRLMALLEDTPFINFTPIGSKMGIWFCRRDFLSLRTGTPNPDTGMPMGVSHCDHARFPTLCGKRARPRRLEACYECQQDLHFFRLFSENPGTDVIFMM